jgi:hypothetical protein
MIMMELKSVWTLSGVSAGSTGLSLVAVTPYVQLAAAALACLSGLLAVALGVLKLYDWFKSRKK